MEEECFTPQGSFLYNKIYDALLERIRDGFYAVGGKLPNDEKLCGEFGISTITLNKALSLLAQGGFVRRVPGRGTFVDRAEARSAGNTEVTIAAPSGEDTRQPFVGLVLEHISTPFGLDMLYEMDGAARTAGYRLFMRFSYGEQEQEANEIEFLRSQGAVGIILMPCHGRHYSQAILKLYLESYPLVLVDKKLGGISLPSVRTENQAAVAELVRALYTKGARHMAFVSAHEEEVASVCERCRGFREQTQEMGLPEPAWFWIPFGRDAVSYSKGAPPLGTLEAARAFLRDARGKIDAIITAEYGFVPALIEAAQAEGIRFGRDMMLASIDGDELSPYGMPFVYMKQDEAGIAKKAMELLVSKIGGRSIELEDYLIPAIFHEGRGIME